ncbi:MAG: ribose-phosphate pyrophosphokinase [Bacteroidales bacterium]|jgi:ribose-phosphate pyrophosphokinase|nr:ribose-phosphate pyrophosphokinase [Bacteroidales bacterium]
MKKIINSESPIKIFTGSASRELAEKIAESHGGGLGKCSVLRFSDGEFQPAYDESVRGATVFIIQSTFPPAEHLFELLLMVDAAKRASASRVVAVIPYFGYARQDRKDRPRCALGAKLVANLLYAAGIDRVITMDLHADPIQGFFDVPVDHLHASPIFVPFLQKLKLKNMIIAAPDVGGTKRAGAYSRFLNVEMAICYKLRKKAGEISEMRVIGEVAGKEVVIIDDMVDTAGTVTTAANLMKEMGAVSVRVVCTHPVLSGPAYERIRKSAITEMFVTDTIPLIVPHPKIKVLSVADILADVINKVYLHQSISDTFI